MEQAFRPGDIVIRLSQDSQSQKEVWENDSNSCLFTGCIELDESLASNIQSRHFSRRPSTSGSSTSSTSSTSPTKLPFKKRQSSIGSITQLHSFQLMIDPPQDQTSSPSGSSSREPIINFTGAEYIPNSLIHFGQLRKIAATFTSVCPFSIEIPSHLFPPRPNQTWNYTISAKAWFKTTDLSSPHAPKLVSTPPAEAFVAIRRMSPMTVEDNRNLDRMMNSLQWMDIEQETVPIASQRPPYGSMGWRS